VRVSSGQSKGTEVYDMLKMLLCGVGIVYLAVRINDLVRSLMNGYRVVARENLENDRLNRSDLPDYGHPQDATSHTREGATV